ncbi:hypothetical protein ACFLSQ_04465 [Bacteroidota bacterium]
MKKLVVFMLLWVILLSLVYLLHSEDQSKPDEKSDVDVQINTIVEKYKDRAYKAFYSLEELRPYSIVQIDQIVEMYDNTWLSPDMIIKKLSDDDKKYLSKSLAEFIDSFKDSHKEQFIVSRIISWCNADMQFSYLNNEMGIYQDNIIQALHNVNKEKQSTIKYFDYKTAESEVMRNEQKEFAYYQTLNMISTMKNAEQLRFYGDVYHQLAEICKK